jgi:hypothetical protein
MRKSPAYRCECESVWLDYSQARKKGTSVTQCLHCYKSSTRNALPEFLVQSNLMRTYTLMVSPELRL